MRVIIFVTPQSPVSGVVAVCGLVQRVSSCSDPETICSIWRIWSTRTTCGCLIEQVVLHDIAEGFAVCHVSRQPARPKEMLDVLPPNGPRSLEKRHLHAFSWTVNGVSCNRDSFLFEVLKTLVQDTAGGRTKA